MFQFTEDCLLGVEEIDEEHKRLFLLLHEGLDMLHNNYSADRYSQIKGLLEELEDYAEQHFAHEEAYMEKLCDPELILQRSQHMFFREKILDFLMQNIDDQEQQYQMLDELIHFLARWLYHHIIGSDLLIGKLPPLEEWMIRENPCEFTEEYMTGIMVIDREHRHLFEIVDRANRLVRSWTDGETCDEFVTILEQLKEYAEFHFADEEEYMKKIGYEGYAVQKRAHEAFISRLEEISSENLEEDPRRYLESLIEFLLGWLVHHILQLDKKIPNR